MARFVLFVFYKFVVSQKKIKFYIIKRPFAILGFDGRARQNKKYQHNYLYAWAFVAAF